MENRIVKTRRGPNPDLRFQLPGALLLFLSLLLASCRQFQTQPLSEESVAAPAATASSNLMVTDPTTVDLASGDITFVWFYAPY